MKNPTLTEAQKSQLSEQSKIAAWTKYLAETASKNTVHIHKGTIFARQLSELASIIERSKQAFISSVFDELNIEQAKINLGTGELTEVKYKKDV